MNNTVTDTIRKENKERKFKKLAIIAIAVAFLIGALGSGIAVYSLVSSHVLQNGAASGAVNAETENDGYKEVSISSYDLINFSGGVFIDKADLDFLSAKYWPSDFVPNSRYKDYSASLLGLLGEFDTNSDFNPDGTAVVLANGEGGAGSVYYEVFSTKDYGSTWTTGKWFHYTALGAYSLGNVYSFDNNQCAFACLYAGNEDENEESGHSHISGIYVDENDVDYDDYYYDNVIYTEFRDMIPNYETNKDIRINTVTQTRDGNYVIVFDDYTANQNGSFYFCGEYDKSFHLISELSPDK